MALDLPHLIEVRNNGATKTLIWARQPSRPDMRTAATSIRAQHGHGFRIGHSWPGEAEQNAPSAWVGEW